MKSEIIVSNTEEIGVDEVSDQNIPQKHICHICGKKFRSKYYLSDHIKIHQEGMKFVCPFCSYRGNYKRGLKSHLSTHHENKIVCLDCYEIFSNAEALSEHQSSIHMQGTGDHQCDQCIFTCKSINTLEKHKIRFHGPKMFECQQCDYASHSQPRLTVHINSVHANYRPYICPHCSYQTSQNGNLQKHIRRRHTKDRPFACNICNYSSATFDIYKRHMDRIHGRRDVFKCKNCSFSAEKKTLLTRHKCSGEKLESEI